MKILYFCNLVPGKAGALESLFEEMGRYSLENGDRFVVALAGEPVSEVAESWKCIGLEWEVINGWSDGNGREYPWRFCLPAVRLLKKIEPDIAVVHYGNEIPAFVVTILAILSGVWDVKWVWQQDQQMRKPSVLTRMVSKIRLLCLTFHHFVVLYEGGRHSMIQRGVPSNRISVINNGSREWKTNKPKGWMRKELGIPAGAVVVLSVAWFVRRKRLDSAITVFSRVCSAGNTPAHFVMVGEGPEKSACEKLTADLGVAGNVHFAGRRNDVSDILGDVDVFIMTSSAEACAFAISEAMSAGIPAVVTDAGAAREQIADGETGYVVGLDDWDAFGVKLKELVMSPELRLRMGRKAKERWSAGFRQDIIAAKLCELYRSL